MALSNKVKYWRRGNCCDNTTMEFFGSFKTEWMPKECYLSIKETEQNTLDYIITHYNSRRGHTYNNYLTPSEAEKRS